jgi:single stranded DNA-binding protein
VRLCVRAVIDRNGSETVNIGEIPVTIFGNLTGDPEMRFTANGKEVANFTVAVNHRKQENGQWVDASTSFARVTAWGELAVNVCESLTRGMPVMVAGTLTMDRWEDKEGKEHDQASVTAIAVGPNLRFAVASVRRPERARKGSESPADPTEEMFNGGSADESESGVQTSVEKRTGALTPAKKTVTRKTTAARKATPAR